MKPHLHKAQVITCAFVRIVYTFKEGFSPQEVLDILLLDMVQDDVDIPVPTSCRKGEASVAVSPEVAGPVLLHRLREQRHYSMAEVAHSMGVSYQNYQQIEAGKNITLKSLKRAAAALGAIVEIKLYITPRQKVGHLI